MTKIFFSTKNKLKAKLAKSILSEFSIEVEIIELDLPEIQSFNGHEVSEFSAKFAVEVIGAPVVVTDVSYNIHALKGFPGPYIKYVNSWLTAEQILLLLEDSTNRVVTITEYLSFATPKGVVKTFSSAEKCSLSTSIKNPKIGSTFDKLVIRNGYSIPQNLMSELEFIKILKKNLNMWRDLGAFIKNRNEER